MESQRLFRDPSTYYARPPSLPHPRSGVLRRLEWLLKGESRHCPTFRGSFGDGEAAKHEYQVRRRELIPSPKLHILESHACREASREPIPHRFSKTTQQQIFLRLIDLANKGVLRRRPLARTASSLK